MQNIIGLITLIAIGVLLIWSASLAWRVGSSSLKWGGVGVATVLAVAVSSVSALMIAGMVKQNSRRALAPDLKVDPTPEQIKRGKSLV